ncbi:MAG: hypothetical protein AAGI07_15720 [Bacteroidota bacterium]
MKRYEIVAVMLLCALPLLLSHQQKLNGPVLAKMQSGEYQQMHHKFAQEVTKPMAGPFYYGFDLIFRAPPQGWRDAFNQWDYNLFSTLAALRTDNDLEPGTFLVPYRNSQDGADFLAQFNRNNRFGSRYGVSHRHAPYIRFFIQVNNNDLRNFWTDRYPLVVPSRDSEFLDDVLLGFMRTDIVFEAFGAPFDQSEHDNRDANF